MALNYEAIKNQYGRETANALGNVNVDTSGIQSPSTMNWMDYDFVSKNAVDQWNASTVGQYNKQVEKKQLEAQQNYAKGLGNKGLYTMLGGQVDPADPWGFYRESFSNKLAENETVDPSNIYRDKLAKMSTGEFGIDDPSYRWRFEQGQQALERSQAAKGLLGSGNAAVELQEYGQGAASQEYGAQFDRMLQALSGVSQQYNTQQTRLMELAGVNLDPLGSRKVGVQEMGNAVSAQGNQLQAQSQANRLGFEQTQWQDQLNMNADYQSGLRQGMTPSPSSTPTYWG